MYFRRDNKELNIDSQLFDPKLMRKADISLVKNTFHNLIKRNAVICERLNQKKKTYYQVNMFVGRLSFEKHKLFCEEDRLASELKTQMRIYREMVDRSLLPHYEQVLEEQSRASDKLTSNRNTQPSDLALVHKQMEQTKEKLEKEKRAMTLIMMGVYRTWQEIKVLRVNQDYASTSVDLSVQEFMKYSLVTQRSG